MSITCNGEVRKPAVTVRLNGKELKEGDCELTWSEGCKDPGTYQVTARLRKGILAGADTAKFIIMGAADEGVLTLPAGLLLIESEAFAGVNAETVIVPKTCRWIDADAFLNCHNLKTVYVYAATVIDDDAFRGCDNVELVRF